MKTRIVITTQMIKEWIKLYQSGLSTCRIAKQYGASQHAVWTNLEKRGVLKRERKDVKEWIRLYVEENETASSIGRKYGVSRDTVRYHLTQNGVKLSKKNARHGLVYDQTICLYDKNETLRYCFENVYEMVDELDMTYKQIHIRLSNIRHGRTKSILLNNKRYTVAFIDNNEEDDW